MPCFYPPRSSAAAACHAVPCRAIADKPGWHPLVFWPRAWMDSPKVVIFGAVGCSTQLRTAAPKPRRLISRLEESIYAGTSVLRLPRHAGRHPCPRTASVATHTLAQLSGRRSGLETCTPSSYHQRPTRPGCTQTGDSSHPPRRRLAVSVRHYIVAQANGVRPKTARVKSCGADTWTWGDTVETC